jgi:formylglycine-generating enzyme required for sulfatase activity
MEFRLVRAEEFVMGHEGDEKRAPRKVSLTSDFRMQTTEVTQAQWDVFMKENPSTWNGPERPMNTVSWDDCQAFIGRLNRHLRGRAANLRVSPTERPAFPERRRDRERARSRPA